MSNYKEQTNQKLKDKAIEISERLPDFIRDFFNEKILVKSAVTCHMYMQRLNTFFLWLHNSSMSPDYFHDHLITDLKPSDMEFVTANDISRFRGWIVTNDRRYSNHSKGVSTSTAESYTTAVNALYKWLIVRGYIKNNPIDHIERNTSSALNPVYLEGEERGKFLDCISDGFGDKDRSHRYRILQGSDIRDYVICMLILDTGIRVSELVGLDIDDINFKECCFSVIRKGHKKEDIQGVVYFSDELKTLLEEYIEHRKQYVNDEKERALFVVHQGKYKGKRLSVRSIELLVKKYAKATVASKAEGFGPHRLRHTFAEELLDATGGDVELIKDTLGHKGYSSVHVYASYNDKTKKNSRNILQNARNNSE